ncbi:MAG: sulfotransferase [Acidimicrobiia bacterium]|nr:sulfotransferase [Acidimicrobiia bacterium]
MTAAVEGATVSGRQKVLFIGGLGRSGSTLVERLLNEWPQTFAVGETAHLWERGVRNRERCGCGLAFDQCPHWQEVGRRAFGRWDEVDLDRIIGLRWSVDRSRRLPAILRAHRTGRPGPKQLAYLDHLRTVLLAAAATARARTVTVAATGSAVTVRHDAPPFGGTGDPVLLESSKHLSTAALLSLDAALDVRLLHLVRDPRGVAYSWTKEVARPEAGDELMPRYSPARTAARWMTDNLGFEVLARRVPSLRMRYEDFLADPVTWLYRIGSLLDLPPDSVETSFLRGSTAHLSTPMHSVAGNPLRFGGSDTTLRLDDAWRRSLPRRDRSLVTALTAPLLTAYGYPLR